MNDEFGNLQPDIGRRQSQIYFIIHHSYFILFL